MRRTTTAILAALLLTGAAVGCTANEPVSSTAADDVTVTPSTEEPADSPEPPAEEEDNDGPFALTHTVTYDHGVKVGLSKFSRGTSSDYAAPANTPYVKFTVKVTNGSDRTLDTTTMMVNCSYGKDGQAAEGIFDDGLDGTPQTKLLAGRSISVPWGCELPKGEQVLQVEVSPDFESEAAIFTGSVK